MWGWRGLAFIFSWCLCSAAYAHPVGRNASTVITLEDESGLSLPVYHHQGQTFALGDYGARYNIRVRNQTGRRVEAVVTVDGRDVISGREGGFSERGYLIDAYGSVLIEGFRKSDHEVAAFRFTSPGDSYSARMGTPQNVGVIGVAIFTERPRPVVRRPQPRYEARGAVPAEAPSRSRSRKSSAGRSASASNDALSGMETMDEEANHLGTEYGETQYSAVRSVQFHRASAHRPSELIALHYDDAAGLARRGIQLHRPRPRPQPEAFPQSRYAPPPP